MGDADHADEKDAMDPNEVIARIGTSCTVTGGIVRAVGKRIALGEKYEEGHLVLGALATVAVRGGGPR